jgi:hypothetical protein
MIRELLIALICALTTGPADAGPALHATTRALLAYAGAQAPAWASSPAWKAVLDLWNKLILFEKTTRSINTTDQAIKDLQAAVDRVVAGLEAEQARGVLGAPTVEATKAILDHQVRHLDRLRSSCYEPMPVGYAKKEALAARLPLLKRLHADGKVDPWLYARALEGIEADLLKAGEDGGRYTEELGTMSEVAMAEALFVQRAFDEHRLAAAVATEAWRSLKADVAPIFRKAGAEAIRDAKAVEARLEDLVRDGMISQKAAGLLSTILSELSGHLFRSGPNAPTCYDMTMDGETRRLRRDALAAAVAALVEEPRGDAAWAAALTGFNDSLWEVLGASAKEFSSKEDPAWRLLSAEIFDLVRHLAP